MNKVKLIGATTGFFLLAQTTSVMAFSFGVGVTGGAAVLEASGTETLRTNGSTTKKSKRAGSAIGSGYAQVQFGSGWTLGAEYFAGGVTLKGKRSEKYDLRNVTSETGDQIAKARTENLISWYAETPGFTRLGLYAKAGYSEFDIKTRENLVTQGTYDDQSGDGWMYGIGFKQGDPEGGMQVKFEVSYTDFDSITFTNSSDSTGNSTIKVEPELWQGKLAIGYNF